MTDPPNPFRPAAAGAPAPADPSPSAGRRRRSRALLAVVLALLGVLIGITGYMAFGPDDGTKARATRTGPTTTTAAQMTSAEVYQMILPSLVLVRAQRDTAAQSSLGSGFVVNSAGNVMTALHVVRNAKSIQLTFSDGTASAATMVSSDPTIDVAVLQPDRGPSVIVPAVIAGTRGARIGDPTYSVGNPLGLAGSMSAGVISGFDRSAPLADGSGELRGLIQFDAAVNPGSSGGPLLNHLGQVVGVVTGLANPVGDDAFAGIGFAVPIGAATGGAAGAPPR